MTDKIYADLHVHSYFSDGSMSPDEIVAECVKNNVGLLAVADHDIIEGINLTNAKCKQNNIALIPAVEIDTLENNINYHVLAYGFDVRNIEFQQYIKNIRFMLDNLSVKLITAMQNYIEGIYYSDYEEYEYNKSLGGWKALHYFMAKGLTQSLKEGIKFYSEFDMAPDKAGYPPISEVCRNIKTAGGICCVGSSRRSYRI